MSEYMDHVGAIERAREQLIRRKVHCPYCGAPPETKCKIAGVPSSWSHIDRYQRAIELDLVPPLRRKDGDPLVT